MLTKMPGKCLSIFGLCFCNKEDGVRAHTQPLPATACFLLHCTVVWLPEVRGAQSWDADNLSTPSLFRILSQLLPGWCSKTFPPLNRKVAVKPGQTIPSATTDGHALAHTTAHRHPVCRQRAHTTSNCRYTFWARVVSAGLVEASQGDQGGQRVPCSPVTVTEPERKCCP